MIFSENQCLVLGTIIQLVGIIYLGRERDKIRSSNCRESIGRESQIAQINGRDQKLASTMNSFSVERSTKPEKQHQVLDNPSQKIVSSSTTKVTETRVKIEEHQQPLKPIVPKIEISISFCDPDDAPVKLPPIDPKAPIFKEESPKAKKEPTFCLPQTNETMKNFKFEAEESDEDLFAPANPQESEELGSNKVEPSSTYLAKRDPNELDEDMEDDDDSDLFVANINIRTPKLMRCQLQSIWSSLL